MSLGLSLDKAGDAASRLVQGAAEKADAASGSGSFFAKALGAVPAAAKSATERAVAGLDARIGGDNRANVERVINGDFKGAAAGIAEKGIKGLPSEVQDTARKILGLPEPTGSGSYTVAGPVGGSSAAAGATGEQAPWGLLSRFLFAELVPCNADGVALTGEGSGAAPRAVRQPATEVNQDITLNWQSPFENAGPESKAPALMGMIQTGQLGVIANSLQSSGVVPKGGSVDNALNNIKGGAKDLEGRTGITRLNSRQVFSGMPPVKVTLTLHFRAFSDAETEVMQPYQRLLEWALPQHLAPDGILSEVITAATQENASLVKALFPSIAPQLIKFVYGNNRFPAMVIESMASPLDGPMDSNGLPIYRSVQMTLATLTALDKNDVAKILSRG